MEVFEPVQLGPVRLEHRLVQAPLFEARSPDGEVTDDLIDFHASLAAGGVAMTTLADVAVSPEGRLDPHRLVLGDGVARELSALAAAVHRQGARVAIQLNHAGPIAWTAQHHSALSPSGGRSDLGTRTHAAGPADLVHVETSFATAAAAAAAAGFDAIELQLGHGFLLSSFLSPKTNRRTDVFGGDLVGRSHFPRRVVAAVRAAVGSDVAVLARLNVADGVDGGTSPDDALNFATLLERDGHLDAVVLSGGLAISNPMFALRGPAPALSNSPGGSSRLGFRLFGQRRVTPYPFEEAYLLPLAEDFRSALSLPLILGGGMTSRAAIDHALDRGFNVVALGRSLLAEPDLPRRYAEGSATRAACTTCNRCLGLGQAPTRCVEFESAPAKR